MAKKDNQLLAVHPGEVLSEDLMKPLGLNTSDLARALKIPTARLRDIVNCRRAIDTNIALRLARYFGSTPEFWMNLQAAYDLEVRTIYPLRSQRKFVHVKQREFIGRRDHVHNDQRLPRVSRSVRARERLRFLPGLWIQQV